MYIIWIMKDEKNQLPSALASAEKGSFFPVYVFLGERPLTAPHVRKLLSFLLPEGERDANLHVFAGETMRTEDILDALHTRSLFAGRKVIRIQDLPLPHKAAPSEKAWSKVLSALDAGDNDKARGEAASILGRLGVDPGDVKGLTEASAKKLLAWPPREPLTRILSLLEGMDPLPERPSGRDSQALQDSLITWLSRNPDPADAVLIIEVESMERKGRFFAALSKHGPIMDATPRTGDKKATKESAACFVRERCAERGKKIIPRAVDLLLDLVGDTDRVALSAEVEKLLAHAGKSPTIEVSDVGALSLRHRDEEVFALTEAVGRQDLSAAFSSLSRLLDQGIHPLALFQALSVFLRRLLLFRSFLEGTPDACPKTPSYADFTREVLPSFTSFLGSSPHPAVSGLHPYALYKVLEYSGKFSTARLLTLMNRLPSVDLELKGGASSARLVLEKFIMESIMSP